MPLVASKIKNAATTAGGCNTSIPSLGKNPLKIEFDNNDFVSFEHVPIFDEHPGQDEGLDIDFTPEILQQIVDASNGRISDTGDLVPVTDRHTSENPNDPEPEILGFAQNFHMDDFGKDRPRKAVYCDMHIYKNKLDKAKSLPRRSIELWLDDFAADPVVLKPAKKNPIDSISLLGAQRPARDLGLLFSKNKTHKHKYRYEVEHGEESMNPEELIKQCIEALMNTPEMAFLRDQMTRQPPENFEHEGFDELTKKLEGEGDSEESAKKIAAKIGDEKYGTEGMAEKSAEARAKNSKEESDMEHEDDVRCDEDNELEPAKLRMQRDQERRKYARLETEHKALYARVEALEREKRVADRKADLLALEGEGFGFDMSEELDYVSDMEPAKYAKHLNRIRKNFSKAPINSNIKPAPVPHDGGVEASLDPKSVYEKVNSLYDHKPTFEHKPGEMK